MVVQGRIDRDASSLSEALEQAGERLDLALALAEVFGGEIDFNSDLQPGDTFRLVVEKSVRDDGQFVGYGPVQAAEFVNDGRALSAVRFAAGDDGKAAYYDTEGRSLQRFFLKSPLKFEPRITSRFSRSRMHPVLRYARAHNGVDYGAPAGAAVGSVVERRGQLRRAGPAAAAAPCACATPAATRASTCTCRRSPPASGPAPVCSKASCSATSAAPGWRPRRTCTTGCDATAAT